MHMYPPASNFEKRTESAIPKWLLFPKWKPDTTMRLTPVAQPFAFMALANNAFNYEATGRSGFDAVGRIIRTCSLYSLVYTDLDDAIMSLDQLANST